MIFILRQIQKKCREQNMGPYAAFVDLAKAFDTISCDGLWKILAHLDCPKKFITILQQLHKGQQGQVKHKGSLSSGFPISNGLKQGCVLAPTLFSIFFSITLCDAKEDLADGIYSKQMAVFNLQHLLTCMKTTEELTHHWAAVCWQLCPSCPHRGCSTGHC